MSNTKKCDFSGKTDVPMISLFPINEMKPIQYHHEIKGEKVTYCIHIIPNNGYGGDDIAEEYVYEELYKLTHAKFNESKQKIIEPGNVS
jgi:hypothetical protein